MQVDTSMITEERAEKLRTLAANRQEGLTLILENIYDPHNLGAVLRTCDSVGISEVYALYTIESADVIDKIAGHKSSSGAKKWVDVHVFDDPEKCFSAVEQALRMVDGNFIIPQSGLTKSLNISVACAVSLYEAKRQRLAKGFYGKAYDEGNPNHFELFKKYVENSKPRRG